MAASNTTKQVAVTELETRQVEKSGIVMENTIKNEKWWRMGHCKDVQTPSRTDTFPVMRGRPFAFQNKGCCWVTDIDAGRGIGTDNRSARGGSLKQIQSDLRGVLEQRTPV